MKKIYGIMTWLSNFIIISLLTTLTSVIGLVIWGIIPAFKTGVITIQRLIDSQSRTTAWGIIRMYFGEWLNQIKSTFTVNILFSFLILGNIYFFFLNIFIQNSLFNLWCGSSIFAVTMLFFPSALLQQQPKALQVFKYLIYNFIKVICLLILMCFWGILTFLSAFPLWILTIGFMCYLIVIIREFSLSN